GLAKRLDVDSRHTQSGAILGTPSYMAPEQAGGKGKEICPATDVYGLGAILYELLTGRPPFRADTPVDTVLHVLADPPIPPQRLQANVPGDLEAICLKCLEKNPAERYHTADELGHDLRRWLEGEPVQVRPIGTAEHVWRWCQRNALVCILSGGLA